ncbi:hypothetical protein [Soonwooa sp.]|uniref:hypothetical protein n=1 Tax=Soonwooa sp. TaxID=1938592 RepID=UPI0026028833|nr:hypothetical protein [Soonwooa sp.]
MKCKYLSIFCVAVLISCKKETQNLTESKTKNDSIRIQKVEDTMIDVEQKAAATPVKLEELNETNLNRITIPLSRQDSSLWLTANMRADHRIFGYAKPDLNSEKLVLFSIFTNEVEKNPFHCKFGSYYQITNDNNFSLKFKNKTKDFVQAVLTDSLNQKHDVYFEKKWIEFD